MKTASIAQAKFIVRCWADGTQPAVLPNEKVNTLTSCIRRGWFVPTGEEYRFPNGQVGIRHCVTRDGLAAAVAMLQQITKTI